MLRNILKLLTAALFVVVATAALSHALGVAGGGNNHATPEMQAKFPELF